MKKKKEMTFYRCALIKQCNTWSCTVNIQININSKFFISSLAFQNYRKSRKDVRCYPTEKEEKIQRRS